MPRPIGPIVILGPTAGGKSALALSLAERFNGEIIGADSMQVYRHLDAGTAKPPPAYRRRVPHHLIDIVDPTERFTVVDWVRRADDLIEQLLVRARVPIVVGGTNLYLQALLKGLFDAPPIDPKLTRALQERPAAALHAQLGQVDPTAAERIHPHDRRRLVRALEVFEATGRPLSQWQTQWDSPASRYQALLIGLRWPVDRINQRINARVMAMFDPHRSDPQLVADLLPTGESLPEETRRLLDRGWLGCQARQALGYKQVIDHFDGSGSLEQACERTKIASRRLAKMQRTWLRRFRNVHLVDAAGKCPSDLAIEVAATVSDCFISN